MEKRKQFNRGVRRAALVWIGGCDVVPRSDGGSRRDHENGDDPALTVNKTRQAATASQPIHGVNATRTGTHQNDSGGRPIE